MGEGQSREQEFCRLELVEKRRRGRKRRRRGRRRLHMSRALDFETNGGAGGGCILYLFFQ